ncbi:acyl-CoA N-acyltransferase [Aspergillus pseudoustus]|uniref:Glucosamine 6-phosphate N-acetyltransferase n=1 Tax=Aspergillus pseudoustus TaxID=1810923 RepID=A0ABR4JQA4_9EURO
MTASSTTPETPLFSTTLISHDVSASLPEGYKLRPLARSDYTKGYLDVLRVLTTVGDISEEAWNTRYDWIAARNDEYYMVVIEDGKGAIVATGSLIVERKFIHALGMVGHIEDIAVEKGQQGKKLGLRLIQALDFIAEKVGAYKTILDCSETNEGFYLKCGFRKAGLEMAHYY